MSISTNQNTVFVSDDQSQGGKEIENLHGNMIDSCPLSPVDIANVANEGLPHGLINP